MRIEDMHLVIRNLEHEDYPRLKVLMDRVYDDIGGSWPEHTINKLIDEFPEGQICVFDGDELPASRCRHRSVMTASATLTPMKI